MLFTHPHALGKSPEAGSANLAVARKGGGVRERGDKTMKTRAEVEALKQSWKSDPCWDIENTEGFEDYRDELWQYRLDTEDNQRQSWQVRVKARAMEINCSYAMANYLLTHEAMLDGRLDALWDAINNLSAKVDALSKKLDNESRSTYRMIEDIERKL